MEKRPIVGPLLTYLAIRYLECTEASKARRDHVLGEIRMRTFDEAEQERFLELMKQHTFTTGHAISEALNLREGEEFRRNSLEILVGGAQARYLVPLRRSAKRRTFVN